ncbi:MAG: hypothetical protein V1827_06330, partial [Candidatus Micrarchaeota archaeon]
FYSATQKYIQMHSDAGLITSCPETELSGTLFFLENYELRIAIWPYLCPLQFVIDTLKNNLGNDINFDIQKTTIGRKYNDYHRNKLDVVGFRKVYYQDIGDTSLIGIIIKIGGKNAYVNTRHENLTFLNEVKNHNYSKYIRCDEYLLGNLSYSCYFLSICSLKKNKSRNTEKNPRPTFFFE